MTILTFYTKEYETIGIPNEVRWSSYAKMHGYKFLCHKPRHLSWHPYWQKIRYIGEYIFTTNEDVLWVDIDVVVKKFSYTLSTLSELSDRDILISTDPNGICAGFMFIRNTFWARSFFEHLLILGDVNDELQIQLYGKPLGDQNTIKYLRDGFPSVKSKFYDLDQTIVSCPETSESSAPFHHYWCNGGDHPMSVLLKGLEAGY